MFDLEKLLTCPLNDGFTYFNPKGCGCAFGIGYIAAGNSTDLKLDQMGVQASIFRDNLRHEYPKIHAIFHQAEQQLQILNFEKHYNSHSISIKEQANYNKRDLLSMYPDTDVLKCETPEALRKWLIDKLVAANAVNNIEVTCPAI